MKKLIYLKADVESGYFTRNERGREPYRYLRLPYVTKAKLEQDVKNGASHFKPLLEMLEKDREQCMLIDCDCFEDGLMAVGYLEGIAESVYRDESDWECEQNYEPEHCPEEAYEDWDDDPSNIPIISIMDLDRLDELNSALPFGDMQMMSNYQRERRDPYWMGRSDIKSICVLCEDTRRVFCGVGCSRMTEGLFAENYFPQFKLLNGYEQVYIIRRRNKSSEVNPTVTPADFMDDMDEDDDTPDSAVCRFLLDYNADRVELDSTKENERNYRRSIFDNYLAQYGMKAGKNFPKDKIIGMLKRIGGDYPNDNIDKAFRYIRKKYAPDNIQEKYFKELGVLVEQKNTDTESDYKESDLIGMEDVKRRVEEIVSNIRYQKCRRDMGIASSNYRNVFLMLGAPGTAKTTIARILGARFAQEHLLKGTKFISLNGAELKGMYVGHTAPQIHRIFEMNDIIFIDEAYSLAANDRGEIDIFSQEALAQLAVELENHGTDRLVLFAGYGGSDVTDKNNKMKDFLDANPGIKSRINSTIYFSSYGVEEMVRIVHGIASKMKFKFEGDVDGLIGAYFAERIKDKNFGNGREARSFVENCQQRLADRVMRIPEEKRTRNMMLTLTLADVEETIRRCREENSVQRGRGRADKYGLY